jgi:hypothetical protein
MNVIISDEEWERRDMAKRRDVGSKVIMIRGKYKGQVGTVVVAWPWEDYWYDVKFEDGIVKQYHWNSTRVIE